MIIKPPETPNQIALLRALDARGSRLISTGLSSITLSVMIPGVPKPTLYTSKKTLRACIKRGWLNGNDKDGYVINGWGIMALGAI